MPNELPIVLDPVRVFPDSGHHVRFTPLLAYDQTTEDDVHRRLGLTGQVDLLSADMRARLRAISNEPPNVAVNAVQPAPTWIRVWFGTQERVLRGDPDTEKADLKAKLIGVWIAVESNLGSRSRGYITRESSPPVQTEMTDYDAQKAVETPYAYEKLADIQDQESTFEVALDGIGESKSSIPLVSFKVTWLRPDGEKPINVDLIVDFGNTRTAVLALEHIAGSPSLAPICKPIPFHATDAVFEGHADFAFDESAVLTDSWFLLRQPQFEGVTSTTREIPEWHFVSETQLQGRWPFRREVLVRRLEKVTYRIPQLFVEMSPALLGPSARTELLRLDLAHGANYFMSSPKRYAWDSDQAEGPGAQNWHMVPRDQSRLTGNFAAIPNLECQMLRFMVADGSDWAISNPPTTWPQQQRPVWNPKNPRYPRSDTLTWTALAIIENAFRTISSEGWRKGNRPYGARQLREILVTYPSGWTANEIEAYRAKWQKAIDIFALTRLEIANSTTLKLVMNLDEAVASQLPIIVSEIRRLGDDGRRWIEVIGRGAGTNAKARVMTIDIGGGTTDISIVEYQDRLEGQGVDLQARVLFKDSSTIAGDELRKMLVERVLLPRVLGNKENLDREKFQSLLSGVQSTMAGYAKWSRYARVLLLPIINRWLTDLVANSDEEFSIVDLFQTDEDAHILEKFNEESQRILGVTLIDPMDKLSLRPQLPFVEQCVKDCFDHPFRALAKHVAAFQCDLVIVSGKPSELPPIRAMLEEFLPLSPNRLIFARGYKAGSSNWPLSADGKVHDAKFVTVVGAALSQAIQSSLINGWMLNVEQDSRMLTQNWWGVPQENRLNPLILNPNQNENTVRLQVGSTIARKLLPGESSPEPVYVLRWRKREWRTGPSAVLEVAIKRVPPKAVGDGESLAIVRAKGVLLRPLPSGQKENIPITENDIELKLCTLQHGDQYWLDTGRFAVIWPNGSRV